MDEDKYRQYIFDTSITTDNELIIADFNEPKENNQYLDKTRYMEDGLQIPINPSMKEFEVIHTKIEEPKIERELPNRFMENEIILPLLSTGESTRINKENYIK